MCWLAFDDQSQGMCMLDVIAAQTDGWRCTGCSGCGVKTASSGSFSDGLGSANYPDNAVCEWVLSPAGAAQVTVTFTSFITEACCDSVRVYSCASSACTNNSILGTLQGSIANGRSFTSLTGYMLISFTTDGSVVYDGFSAFYTSSSQAV